MTKIISVKIPVGSALQIHTHLMNSDPCRFTSS